MRSLVMPRLAAVWIAAVVAAGCAASSPPTLVSSPGAAATVSPEATAMVADPAVVAAEAEVRSAVVGNDAAAMSDESVVEEAAARATATRRCIRALPLRQRVGQLLVPLTTPGDLAVAARMGANRRIGGVVLLGAPTVEQVALLDRAAQAGVGLLVGSDEEGGRVQRLAGPLGPLPSAAVQATRPPREVRQLFADYGAGLADFGVDVAFAPVVDVGGGPGIGDRAFSDDPAVVTRYAGAVIDGYERGGIIPVIKHFPGHGRASGDTHLGFATTPPLSELRATDLVPYETLLGEVDVVMVGHLLVPGLTMRRPTSLSRRAISGLLRNEMGFTGVVITDALGMGAVAQRWSNPDAAVLALRAGADLAMIDSVGQVPVVLDRLVEAVRSGELSRRKVIRSVAKTMELRGIDPCTLAG